MTPEQAAIIALCARVEALEDRNDMLMDVVKSLVAKRDKKRLMALARGRAIARIRAGERRATL